jgi:hypothetical protein
LAWQQLKSMTLRSTYYIGCRKPRINSNPNSG